jgi:hypothetical protein
MEAERISLKFQILFERRERESERAKKKLFSLVSKLHGVRLTAMYGWKMFVCYGVIVKTPDTTKNPISTIGFWA